MSIVKHDDYEFGLILHNFVHGWRICDGEKPINFIDFFDKYGIESFPEKFLKYDTFRYRAEWLIRQYERSK